MDRNANENTKFIDFIKALFFLFIVIQALIFNNAFITFGLFILLFFLEKKYLLSIILVSPIIETILIVVEGVTITKLLVIFYTFYFLYVIVKENAVIIDKKSWILLVYLFIVIFGLFNAITFGPFLSLVDWDYNAIINENFISYIPKILFSILLYSYIKIKGYNYLRDNLRYLAVLISIALIIIAVYFFITISNESSNWWNVARRFTFKGADPNNFASILSSLSIFPLYLILKSRTKREIVVGIISVALIYFSIFLTLSKGGTLTLIFSIILTFFVLSKKNVKRSFFVLSLGIIIIAILVNFEIIDFSPLYERFFGEHIYDISSFTTRRSDWWLAGIKAIKQRPILGFGGSFYAGMWINYTAYGEMFVMHSLYIEILVQYGILGLIVFLWIIVRILKDFKQLINKLNKGQLKDTIFLIPFISLLTCLFAGLSLSWQWRDLLWFFISICLGVGSLTGENIKMSNI
ncbi:O-antigen ligase family protein [Defluviitoga tunisiensis]|uniref:O-Antigen ligase n=1 Tax=Defluviitoga tunisiensis TaxID=1006576 RepID=A0A0C7NR51_DEFTU|nr:O-antigen ligase family protein [Defluviitoga tunisiensis]CEP78297.1 O-Antigen ligase [Defluviitoga tunisiensis]